MKAIMVDGHDGEGSFPVFSRGEAVENLEPCQESAHWMSCSIKGMATYIPDIFVKDGFLVREYNPTELVAHKDEIIEIEEIVYEWLYAGNTEGAHGWVPAEKVTSIG